jgi:polyribonucleotide 5'-hydroxyl-kinase
MHPPRQIDTTLAKVHAILEVVRAASASGAATSGPRVVVAGETDTGKSSTALTLTNNAVGKHGITFVDLDPGQGSIGIPGALAAVFLEASIPVDDGFASTVPLCFFHGAKKVDMDSRKRYLDLCSCLSQCVSSLADKRENFRRGGVMVNTMGWVTGLGYDLLREIIDIFKATHVIVTGSNHRLMQALESDVVCMRSPDDPLVLIPLKRNARVQVREGLMRQQARHGQLEVYWKGTPRTPLLPCRIVVMLKDVMLFDTVTLQEIRNSAQIRPLSVAAIPHADTVAEIDASNVAGFVIVLEVGGRTLSLLAPSAGPLPRPILLVSKDIFASPEDVPPISV